MIPGAAARRGPRPYDPPSRRPTEVTIQPLADQHWHALPAPEVVDLRRFAMQFVDSLALIFMAAGVVTVFLNDLVDAAVIFGVVMLNAVVGYVVIGLKLLFTYAPFMQIAFDTAPLTAGSGEPSWRSASSP